MATDLIRYDLLIQDALRSVVRKVLSDVAQGGLQGEHHFKISFRTHAPGVQLSSRMRADYPIEMTIILQHQFWGLKVTEHAFEVGLSFHKVPETLIIPFDALTGFYDPSVQFTLKFESEIGANDVDGPFDTDVPKAETSNSDPVKPAEQAGETAAAQGLLLASPSGEPSQDLPRSDDAKVISFEAFRKKP
jgi:hypothetical protein